MKEKIDARRTIWIGKMAKYLLINNDTVKARTAVKTKSITSAGEAFDQYIFCIPTTDPMILNNKENPKAIIAAGDHPRSMGPNERQNIPASPKETKTVKKSTANQ